MSWLETVAFITVFVVLTVVLLVMALCRAAKLSEEVDERSNRGWMARAGQGDDDPRWDPAFRDVLGDRADGPQP